MRHVYIRLVFGIVFLLGAVYNVVKGDNTTFLVLFLALAGVYLYSAYSEWKKHKNDKDNKGE